MAITPEDAADLFARIERDLPREEDKPAHPRTSAQSRAIRERYYTEDTRAARRLLIDLKSEWAADYARALDAEQTLKICFILRTVLVYLNPEPPPLLPIWLPSAPSVPNIVGGFSVANATPRPVTTGAFWLHVHRGVMALLKEKFDVLARQMTALFLTEPRFTNALTKAFARAGFALVPCEISKALEPPEMEPPAVAPRLWADRPAGMKAAQFLRETYAPWIEAGVLTRGALKACDPPLYRAYHVWVHRHPEDVVPFKDAPPYNLIADPAEAIERRRESVKNAMTRYRAKKAMAPSPAA